MLLDGDTGIILIDVLLHTGAIPKRSRMLQF